ncbi:MAG: hypothetical protein IJU60_03570 [Acholeplasmatales bacterium]|nr:hypothetical protein [Acholeplasmatales bacterium]
MIYEYILKNFAKGEPIFLNEIPGSSKDVVRQEMKRLTDDGKLRRLYNGVYYVPYKTILGTDGKVSIDQFVEKKYLSVGGFLTGLALVNKYGFTSQNPSVYEICSNEATTKQRKLDIDGNNLIIYKPLSLITKENIKELEFLSLMSIVDKYSELTGDEYKNKLKEYVNKVGINFVVVKKYISLFPNVVYKNIYEGGLMNELV